ncbi:hypothetical protein MSAN_02040700 [Mycena sanguinolenta]|uniref:Uncharacterized protein n=1 Tax=Mycena sanguinolenta TaxID=230812 RepID=A0A8H6XIU2_9AGAR|nr:hypothetical protein MSAN_02040700 [Mycena sanguinolenta]
MIPNLMLVASRVKHWVEPLLYRVLILSSGSSYLAREIYGFPIITISALLRLIAAKSHSPQNAVKILVSAMVFDIEMEPILAACSNVSDTLSYCEYAACCASSAATLAACYDSIRRVLGMLQHDQHPPHAGQHHASEIAQD